MTRVAVTGATGYIGRRLMPALIARGHEVCAIIRLEQPPPSGTQRILGVPEIRRAG